MLDFERWFDFEIFIFSQNHKPWKYCTRKRKVNALSANFENQFGEIEQKKYKQSIECNAEIELNVALCDAYFYACTEKK